MNQHQWSLEITLESLALMEERGSVERTGVLLNPVSSIVQKPGKLSDQSIQLLIGGWSGILLLQQGIHSSRGWLLDIDRLPMTDLNCLVSR